MEPQHPLSLRFPGGGRDRNEGRGAISLHGPQPWRSQLTESRGLLGLGLHNAGYFHPDVLCHHRLGHSVLHYLSALAAGSCAGSLRESSSEGKNGAEGPSILLAAAPGDLCFWSLFWVLIQKRNEKRACFPIYFSDARM